VTRPEEAGELAGLLRGRVQRDAQAWAVAWLRSRRAAGYGELGEAATYAIAKIQQLEAERDTAREDARRLRQTIAEARDITLGVQALLAPPPAPPAPSPPSGGGDG
jgi:hypothetical protein